MKKDNSNRFFFPQKDLFLFPIRRTTDYTSCSHGLHEDTHEFGPGGENFQYDDDGEDGSRYFTRVFSCMVVNKREAK